MSKLEIHTYGYSTAGFELPQIIVRAETPEEAAALLAGLAKNGITATPPDPAEVNGEKSETIVCVVKRIHISKSNQETAVVDFYPAWQGEYGQFRFVGVYLNTAEQIAEFEQRSGLKLADMPVYESQGPLQRNATRKHRCEIPCRPFVAQKIPDGVKEIDGKEQTVWKFAGYGDAAQTPASQPPQQEQKPAGNGNGSAFKAPSWWNAVLKVAIPKYYDGVQPHATNSVKKLLADGTLTAQMTVDQVLGVLQGRWEAEEAEQPPVPDYSDIPF